MGRNANGLREWKLKNGMTLKEFEQPDDCLLYTSDAADE